jgi:hypothetical protein
VASALVAVSRMRLATVPGLAFGSTGLERRVVRLLEGQNRSRASRTSHGAVAMAVFAGLVVFAAHERLHHVVEELWELAIRP